MNILDYTATELAKKIKEHEVSVLDAVKAVLEQIEVIPTLVIYKGGQALASVVAPESKASLMNCLMLIP